MSRRWLPYLLLLALGPASACEAGAASDVDASSDSDGPSEDDASAEDSGHSGGDHSGETDDSGESGDTSDGGCPPNTVDCNGDPADGCEAEIERDPENCGGCGESCGGGTCEAGQCQPEVVSDDFDALGAADPVAQNHRYVYWRQEAVFVGGDSPPKPILRTDIFTGEILLVSADAPDDTFLDWLVGNATHTCWLEADGADDKKLVCFDGSDTTDVVLGLPWTDARSFVANDAGVFWREDDSLYAVAVPGGSPQLLAQASQVFVFEDTILYVTLGGDVMATTDVSPGVLTATNIPLSYPGVVAVDEDHVYISGHAINHGGAFADHLYRSPHGSTEVEHVLDLPSGGIFGGLGTTASSLFWFAYDNEADYEYGHDCADSLFAVRTADRASGGNIETLSTGNGLGSFYRWNDADHAYFRGQPADHDVAACRGLWRVADTTGDIGTLDLTANETTYFATDDQGWYWLERTPGDDTWQDARLLKSPR